MRCAATPEKFLLVTIIRWLITQLSLFQTTVGYWGVGPLDQPFGRYARGFDPATGRTDMSFVLSPQLLWGGLPLVSNRTLTLAVTHLDGTDGFDIYIDTHLLAAALRPRARSLVATSRRCQQV